MRGVAPCGVVPNLHLVVSFGEGVVPRGGGLSVDGPNPRPNRRGRLGGPNELVRPIQFTTHHAVGVASHKRRGPPRHVCGVRFGAGPQRHGGHKRPAPHGADHIQFVVGTPHVPRDLVHGLGDAEHRRAVFAQGLWIQQPRGDGGKHGVIEAQRVFASVLSDQVGGVRAWARLVEVERPRRQTPVVQEGVFLQVQRHAANAFPTQRRRGGFQLSLRQGQDVHGDGLRFRLTPVDGGRGDVVA